MIWHQAQFHSHQTFVRPWIESQNEFIVKRPLNLHPKVKGLKLHYHTKATGVYLTPPQPEGINPAHRVGAPSVIKKKKNRPLNFMSIKLTASMILV